MRKRRDSAFTLLEVVLAVSLLAAMTVALLPLLVDATQTSVRPHRAIDPSDLLAASDEWLGDERRVAALLASGEAEFAIETAEGPRRATARLVAGSDSRRPHDWIEFRSDGVRVVRYLTRPAPDEDEGDLARAAR